MNGAFHVNQKQLKLILFLYGGSGEIRYRNTLHELYIKINWPNLTITRIAQALERKNLVRKVSDNPPTYELTDLCKNYIRMIRRGGV